MTADRNLLAILVCALAVSSALGQSGPASPNSGPGFHVTGILPTKDHPNAAPAQQPASNAANVPFNGITYNGGEVMDDPHGTNVYYIWYGDWSRDPLAQTILTDFISDIGASWASGSHSECNRTHHAETSAKALPAGCNHWTGRSQRPVLGVTDSSRFLFPQSFETLNVQYDNRLPSGKNDSLFAPFRKQAADSENSCPGHLGKFLTGE
jgi:hypothetical protein